MNQQKSFKKNVKNRVAINRNNAFKKEFGLIIIGALIFTASFLWKDFLSDIRDEYFPKTAGLVGRFLYLLVVTSILVLIVVYLKNKIGVLNTPYSFDTDPIDNNNNNNNNNNNDEISGEE